MPTENTQAQPEPVIRLFKSDFLEFFTHISPVAVLVVFLPLIGFLLWRAARFNPAAWWNVPLAFLIGFAVMAAGGISAAPLCVPLEAG